MYLTTYKLFACFVEIITTYILAGIIIVVSSLHILVFCFATITKSRKKSFKVFFPLKKILVYSIKGMVFTLALTFSILTIVNVATECCGQVTWHFGLFAVTSGWAYLIHLCSKLPLVGEQAIVFIHIVWTFLKLSLFSFLLVLAATIILAMTLFNAQAQVSCSQ